MDWQHYVLIAWGVGFSALSVHHADAAHAVSAGLVFLGLVLALFKKSPFAKKAADVVVKMEGEEQ